MKDCVYFLQALTVLQTKGMAGIRASRNREFFYYPLSAFSFLVKVKNGRYCRKMDYRSPMMLVVWASYPDHQVHLLIWVLGHDINIPLKELRGVFFKS